jgi:hypothetical protein
MTKTIWIGTTTAIVAAATVAVMAQAPGPQQPSGTSTDRQVTVTGCLKPAPPTAGDATTTAGTAGATGTSGAVGAAGSAEASFVLTDAMTSSAATDPAGASSSSTAGSQAARSTQTYRLIANPAALSPHVGKKLELTGTVEDQPSSASSSGSPAGSAKALRVEAGKVIAASCEG